MHKHLPLAALVAIALTGCTATVSANVAPKPGASTGTTTGTTTGNTTGGTVTGSVTTGANIPTESSLGAAITHNANITASETWHKGLHIVDGEVTVSGSNAPVLTIEPGCIIKFTPGSRLFVKDNGGLLAQGGAGDGQGILFTSSNGASSNKGDWQGLLFSEANSSQTKLSYCVVEFAGKTNEWTSDGCGVYSAGANFAPSFDHLTVRNCNGFGFQLGDSHPAMFTNTTVTGCSSLPVSIAADAVGTLGAGNTFTGNAQGMDAVQVNGGTISHDETWTKQSVPYRVQGSIEVGSDNGAAVTIAPGTTVQMGQGANFDIGYNGVGAFTAAGTADQKITFTSLPNATNPGEWGGIAFWDKTNVGKSKLDQCVIQYAGGDDAVSRDHAALFFSGVNVPVTNTQITNSASFAIAGAGDAVKLVFGADVTFSGNAGGNIKPI